MGDENRMLLHSYFTEGYTPMKSIEKREWYPFARVKDKEDAK